MKKKIYLLAILFILFVVMVLFLFRTGPKLPDGNIRNYFLGKTPHSFLFTFCDEGLLFKDDVKIQDSFEFQGLYFNNLKGKEILLADNYYCSVNYYDDSVYYIDNNFNIRKVDVNTQSSNIVVQENGNSIKDILIIDDIMYYIQDKGSEKFSLFGYNLSTGKVKEIAEGISFHYLYDYCGSAGVIIKESNKFAICSYEKGVEKLFDNLEYEIQGFLPDQSIVYYDDGVYCKKNFDDENSELLFECDNISRIIFHSNEIIFSTIDEYGLIEVYLYNFEEKKYSKIANSSYEIRDFNDEYIACGSDDGLGSVNLIDRKTGEQIILSEK